MIPTMIIFGVVLGRWWKTALVLGTVVWVVVLLSTDAITVAQIPGGAVFGLVNTGIGVAVHQGVLWLVRHLRAARSGLGEQRS